MTPYLDELRVKWRPIAAALFGMGGGLMFSTYVMGIMAPYLIEEFGWQRSQFALVSALGLVTIFSFPIIGRLTDTFGVRPVAFVGAVASPLLFLGLSQLNDLRTYSILFTLQCFFLVTTTPPIYCRIVMQYIERARGLALGIVTAGPAFIVAAGGPLLNAFVAEYGWRSGYLALVAFTAATGLLAMILLPSERKGAPAKAKHRAVKGDYGRIVKNPAFWIILAATFLVSFPQSMMMTQLSLIVAENGLHGAAAGPVISLFASGTLLGRFVAGLALDRFSPRYVALIGCLLSALGLFIFASGVSAAPLMMAAGLLMGLTIGAEGDVVAYLVVRNFGVRIYSSVAGLTASMTAISALVCSISLSVMLHQFNTFVPFLILSGVCVVIGSFLFLLLPAHPEVIDETVNALPADASHGLAQDGGGIAKSTA